MKRLQGIICRISMASHEHIDALRKASDSIMKEAYECADPDELMRLVASHKMVCDFIELCNNLPDPDDDEQPADNHE